MKTVSEIMLMDIEILSISVIRGWSDAADQQQNLYPRNAVKVFIEMVDWCTLKRLAHSL